jgi:hypothetical protein
MQHATRALVSLRRGEARKIDGAQYVKARTRDKPRIGWQAGMALRRTICDLYEIWLSNSPAKLLKEMLRSPTCPQMATQGRSPK